jgi:hypothetical protein
LDAPSRKLLFEIFPQRLFRAFPGIRAYPATREVSRTFISGTRFFRRELATACFSYVAVSPGEAREKNFHVLVGWGFSEALAPHDYFEQVRALYSSAGPSRHYAAGFFGLDKIEGVSRYAEEIDSSLPLVDSVGNAVSRVMNRLCKVVPPYEDKIVEEFRHRNAA